MMLEQAKQLVRGVHLHTVLLESKSRGAETKRIPTIQRCKQSTLVYLGVIGYLLSHYLPPEWITGAAALFVLGGGHKSGPTA